MRIVYDTNVLATILLRRGEILKLKQIVIGGLITPITSEFILDELAEVLHSRLGLTRQRAKANLRVYAKVAEVVKLDVIERVARDPDDDFVLATALAGQAAYILTHDKDLLVLNEYKGIKIVTPADFRKQQ